MLIDNIDYTNEIQKIANFLSKIKIAKAYVAIPTRPPGEKWVKPAREELINNTYQIFSQELGKDLVEYLIGYEGDIFSFSGNIKKDLLSITSVHPMREDAVNELLKRAGLDWTVINDLENRGKIIEEKFQGHTYYMRRLSNKKAAAH